MQESENKYAGIVKWAKRIGWIGVLFFTLKGLAWLAVISGLGKLFGL